MRHGQTGRRLRNRGSGGGGGGGHSNNQRRSGGGGGGGSSGGYSSNRNHVYDSNGPEVRIRGTAHQIQEKYTALAKDASSSGDLVLSESYLQHAEHYQRIINSWAEFAPQRFADEDDSPYNEPRQSAEAEQSFAPMGQDMAPQAEFAGQAQS